MFSEDFIDKTITALYDIEQGDIEIMVDVLSEVRNRRGRLFIVGSGGGAGHASHAVSDFRKLCNFEAYAPYDNVSELTARTNDEGYSTSIVNYLKVSGFCKNDCLFVISVGGGDTKVSRNLFIALSHAQSVGATIVGIVGRDGGLTKELADAYVLIPTIEYVTPITEGLQAVVWHLLVTHPKLAINKTTW